MKRQRVTEVFFYLTEFDRAWSMSFDTFVKIDGIEGECGDTKHDGWIEVISYGVAHLQKASSTASSVGGASTERADFSEFMFTKYIDKASPLLALACASGTHLDNIYVELCRAGGEKVKFMQYKLTHCLISSVSTGSKGRRFFPAEHISINFGKIEWAYTQQARSGGWAAGNVAGGWNLEKNTKM